MNDHGRARRAILAALLSVMPAGLGAQSVSLVGRVVDGNDQPVPGIDVVLHRVDQAGGESLATARSDSAGGFTLVADATADTSAVYFAAARLDGELFVGPFVRPPFDSGPGYVLVLAGDPISLGPVPRGAGTVASPVVPPSTRRRALALIPLAGLVGVGWYALRRRGRATDRRRLLARVAALDEAGGAADPASLRERERIMERLLEP